MADAVSSIPDAGVILSAAESRPTVQGEVQDEKPKQKDELNPFYAMKFDQLFSEMDADDDGTIVEEEVFAFIQATWGGYDPAEVTQKFLTEADVDHNGHVSKREWRVFAERAKKSGQSKAERWHPLEHLKTGVHWLNSELEKSNERREQRWSIYTRVSARVFHGMDKNGDDVATKAEMEKFFDRKFHERGAVGFAEKILAEADTNGDGKASRDEFMNFAALSRKTGTSRQEKWDPLLHVFNAVRHKRDLNNR